MHLASEIVFASARSTGAVSPGSPCVSAPWAGGFGNGGCLGVRTHWDFAPHLFVMQPAGRLWQCCVRGKDAVSGRSGLNWPQNTDPVCLLKGWLILKVGPTWGVELLNNRAVVSMYVCAKAWECRDSGFLTVPCGGGGSFGCRDKGLAGPSQPSILQFPEAGLLLFIESSLNAKHWM